MIIPITIEIHKR